MPSLSSSSSLANDHEHPFLTYPYIKIYIFTGLPEKTSPGWFIFHRVFLLSFVSLINLSGPTSLPVWNLWKPLFLSVVTMFYIFASFKQIWITKYTDFVEATIESGRGGGQKIIRTIRQVSGRINYHRIDWIEPLERVSLGLLQRDKWCLQCLFHLFHFCNSQKNITF